jgi:transcriptional regulator with XRE-family HTH domain
MPPLKGRYGPPPSVVADRIRAERIRLGLSVAGAARMLGVGRLSYLQLERGANPQYSTLVALVEVLGMDPRAVAVELFTPSP